MNIKAVVRNIVACAEKTQSNLYNFITGRGRNLGFTTEDIDIVLDELVQNNEIVEVFDNNLVAWYTIKKETIMTRNVFTIAHSLQTSYNMEIEPMVYGYPQDLMNQEFLRELIANDCWDYEDDMKLMDDSEYYGEDMSFYQS